MDECRIGWLTSVGRAELTIGRSVLFSVKDCLRTSTHQLGSIGAELGGQRVELLHEIVVELYEYFTSGHDHMLSHMVAAQNIEQ